MGGAEGPSASYIELRALRWKNPCSIDGVIHICCGDQVQEYEYTKLLLTNLPNMGRMGWFYDYVGLIFCLFLGVLCRGRWPSLCIVITSTTANECNVVILFPSRESLKMSHKHLKSWILKTLCAQTLLLLSCVRKFACKCKWKSYLSLRLRLDLRLRAIIYTHTAHEQITHTNYRR